MRDEELREQSEKYLNAKIPDILWEIEKRKAECKLERMIQREGDANGERRKSYYLAQLIAEAIAEDVYSMQCMKNFEDKKRNARRTDKPQHSLIIA